MGVSMRLNLLISLSLLLFIQSCATRAPDSARSASGGGSKATPHTKADRSHFGFGYQQAPLKDHYYLAIPNEDNAKMREWVAAGFAADTRMSPQHPSAIEQAISYSNVEVVKMLSENPDPSKR